MIQLPHHVEITQCGGKQYDIQQKKLIRGAHWTKDKEEVNDGINVGQRKLFLKQIDNQINTQTINDKPIKQQIKKR